MRSARFRYVHPDGRTWTAYARSWLAAVDVVSVLFSVEPEDVVSRLEQLPYATPRRRAERT